MILAFGYALCIIYLHNSFERVGVYIYIIYIKIIMWVEISYGRFVENSNSVCVCVCLK